MRAWTQNQLLPRETILAAQGARTAAERDGALASAQGGEFYINLVADLRVPLAWWLRARALPLAFAFANQAPAVLARYEHAASSFSFGWSPAGARVRPLARDPRGPGAGADGTSAVTAAVTAAEAAVAVAVAGEGEGGGLRVGGGGLRGTRVGQSVRVLGPARKGRR